MKIVSARVLDTRHLELSEPIAAKEGDLIEISIPDPDEADVLWKTAAPRQTLTAYDAADAIYDE